MEREIINKIISSLKPKIEAEEYPHFSDKRYKAFKISKENFHKIEEKNSNNKIAFIDGGNLEIIGGADFSLNLIRIYYTTYQKNKRIKSSRKEFYALVSTASDGEEISYKTGLFPENSLDIDKKDIIFNSFDSTIREGTHRIKISKIGEIIRRFAELKTASEIAEELSEGDIMVRDGSLQSSVTNESKFFSELYKTASERKIIVAGLSKTSSLLTDKGNSLSTAIKSISPEGSWYYHPVAEISHPDHQAEMFFIRLNENSKHIFRFEVYKKQNFDINNIFSLLSENSKDPSFMGYPYGLIEADKFARVSENEKILLKTRFMAIAGKEWKKISEKESAVDAHQLLL